MNLVFYQNYFKRPCHNEIITQANYFNFVIAFILERFPSLNSVNYVKTIPLQNILKY